MNRIFQNLKIECEEKEQPNASQARAVEEWTKGKNNHVHTDEIAAEIPVALVYNGISHAVMMTSPTNLEEFAIGFSFTEGIINQASDIYDIDFRTTAHGIEISIQISSLMFNRLKEHRRQLTGRTGCGICGKESLKQIQVALPLVKPMRFNHLAIERAVNSLDSHQPIQSLTGAVHGAAWCNLDGKILYLREDIGRHNALDKLIGYRLLYGLEDPGFVLVSSRASYEMVQKAAFAGFSMLVSVSAATNLAIEMAERCRMTLVGFARTNRHVIYTASA